MSVVKRFGSVVQIIPDKIKEYKTLHESVWPEVLEENTKSNISNYSIFLHELPEGNYYLFSYLEYTGHDFDADMSRMADIPIIKKWWELCKPMHIPLPNRKPGEWWATMEPVFYQP